MITASSAAACGCPFYPRISPASTSPSSVEVSWRPSPRRGAAVRCQAAVEAGGATGATFYDLLGVSEGVGIAEIKQAYRGLARRYHPDVCPADRAEEFTRRFIEVQLAYETLSDPTRRDDYDRHLTAGLHLAFSSRHGFDVDTAKSGWKNHWESQLAELKRRGSNKDSGGNQSWGARMRRRRDEPGDD